MTPKEKAKELVDEFMEHTVEWDKIKEVALDSKFHAKQCALIAVDEIIQNQKHVVAQYELKLLLNGIKVITFSNYWESVKNEIEKL